MSAIDKARLSVNSRLTGLDPTIHHGLSAFITQYLIWGQLFQLRADNSVEPQLAEGIEFEKKGLAAMVHLKPGLCYSDGTAIVAGDVVFVIERNRQLKGPRFFLLDGVTSVSALDERTIAFKLERPCWNLGVGLADAGFSILSRAELENDAHFFSHPISSGQYLLKEWTPGSDRWRLTENPHFWGGRSRIRELEFVVIDDLHERIRQLNNGELEYAYDLPSNARGELDRHVETYTVPIQGVEAIKFNHAQSGPLAEPQVRQAISLAIDRDAICQNAYGGLAHPVNGFLYPGVPEALAVLPNAGKRDAAAAQALLSATAWREGFSFTLQTWSQRPGRPHAAHSIKRDLADIGIDVQVEPIPDAVAISNLTTGNYQAQLSGNTQDPLTFLKNQFGAGGTITTKLRYHNPVITRLLNDAAAVHGAERIALLHRVQRLAYEGMPVIPLCDRVVLIANRLGRDVICEANRQPGFNPIINSVGIVH